MFLSPNVNDTNTWYNNSNWRLYMYNINVNYALNVLHQMWPRVKCPTTNVNDSWSVLQQMWTTRYVFYHKCERELHDL